jgi:1-pyrroline-5-carboxylate dehydrogenase
MRALRLILSDAESCRQRSYALGSAERKGLEAALAQMQQELPFEVPCIVNGLPVCKTCHQPIR